MNKSKKIWLFTATAFVLIGIFLFSTAMSANHWNFSNLSTVKYETNTTSVVEKFSNIDIQTDTANIFFVPSEDGLCKVICHETEKNRHSVIVQNETLTIHINDEREWYDYIGITWETPQITVYLPEKEYASLFIKESTGDIAIPNDFHFQSMDISLSTGDIKNYASASENMTIKTTTGDIQIENISAKTIYLSVSTGYVDMISAICEENIEIKVSTGKVKLADVSCKNLISKGSTGDISLINLIAKEQISIKRNTGDVKFSECDANEIFIKTSTGKVSGSLLSEKTFITNSNTGDIDVPKNTIGGKCEITTDTGNIKITIK